MVLESHVYKPFKQYAPGLGCRGKCEYSQLVISPPRKKGFTCQQEGIKYCKRCAVHYKPETGLRCPCCNQRLKGRINTNQSKVIRELTVALNLLCSRSKAPVPIYRLFGKEETYIQE